MKFKDYFSQQSDIYLSARPHYPPELYAYLSSLVNEHQLCWDCGTGNGQAAVQLASYFDTVIATDPSADQIKRAYQHDKVEYRVEKAEDCTLEPESVDLIAVASALHWFDIEAFFQKVDEVLKPGGILAVWAYTRHSMGEEVDKVVSAFANKYLPGYWKPELKIVWDKYNEIIFPYPLLQVPDFEIVAEYDFNRIMGYFRSWSAVQLYIDEKGEDPTKKLRKDLLAIWGGEDIHKEVSWEVFSKICRKPID